LTAKQVSTKAYYRDAYMDKFKRGILPSVKPGVKTSLVVVNKETLIVYD
jgi:hypothetical protein